MSLQAWYPLNGTVNDYGLGDHPLTKTPPFNDNGKIGKCAIFNGNATQIVSNNTKDFNYTNNFSYCIWINYQYNATAGSQWIFTVGRADYGGYGYGLQVVGAQTLNLWFGKKIVPITCNSNEWHHIAFTVCETEIKIYLDGKLNKVSICGELPTYSDGNGLGIGGFHYTSDIYPYFGRVNDLRIFNHCLSAKEIKEISKGLIVHYKLNCVGAENLMPQSLIVNKGCTTFSYDSVNNLYNCVAPIGSDNWGYGLRFMYNSLHQISILKGQTICFSLIIKPDVECKFSVDVNNATQDGKNPSGNDNDDTSHRVYAYSTLKPNVWNKVYWTYTAKLYDLYERDSNCGIVTTNLKSPVSFQIKNIKVELGNIPTSWCPNKNDSLYNSMGYNNKTEYDCSGYSNNGTIISNIKWDYNTKRYTGSYYFTNPNHLKCPCPLSNPETLSCSFWFKPISIGSYATIACNYGNPSSGFWLAVNCEGNGLWFYNGAYGRSDKGLLNINQWYHACFVFDKGIITWYQNGELAGTTDLSGKSKTLGISNYISISNSYTGNSWNTNYTGNISDFRIYSTALTLDDVKVLYNMPISLSKDGSVFAYEYIEGD